VPEREVEVYRFERIATDRFVIECSAGTYVRSLIADLGDAYCTELRRLRIGPFDVADASEERVVALDDALAFLPAVELDGEDARRASHGVAVPGHASAPTVRLRDTDGLIALAEPREPGLLKPVVGFRG
jgi:tRNA pseudouridine55 synthase